MLLLRRSSHLKLVRQSFYSTCPSPVGDPLWISKIISTLFLFSSSPSAAAFRLTSLRHLITPDVAVASLRRLRDHPSAALSLLRHVSLPADAHRHVIDLLLTSSVRSGDLDSSLRIISEADNLKIPVQSYAFNNILTLLISRNRVQDAILMFECHLDSQIFAPDTCTFNVIIKGCCQVGDTDRAFQFFHRMRDFHCYPDTITHNLLISGLCKANRVDRGRQLLREIQSNSLCAPNVVTFTSVISGYCKLGKMEDAFEVFDEMVRLGIRPNHVSYNVLIDGYGKAGNMQMAVSIYEKMMVCGCTPDVVTFTSLIDGYTRSGQLDEAMRLWVEMGQRRIRPNVYTFAIMINSLCKKNRVNEARVILKELNGRKDVAARAFIYNPVIDGFCKVGDLEEANMVMVEMEERGCSPDKFTYTILIIGHCMKGRMWEAINLFDRMVITGCAPDGITISSLVSCLLKAGMPGEANRVMIVAPGKCSRSDSSSSKEIPLALSKSVGVSVAV